MPVENPLENLPEDARKVALQATEALMRHKQFLPRGGLLLMLVSRFRDDTREALALEPERYPGHGGVFRSLDDLTSTELGKLAVAVAVLLQPRFAALMDDPELPRLLGDFRAELDMQKAERAQLQASIAS